MSDFLSGNERRAIRLAEVYEETELLSKSKYNASICLVLIYGLVLNAYICKFYSDYALRMNPLLLILVYIVCCILGIALTNKATNPVLSFIGYNLVVIPMGLTLSVVIAGYGGINAPVIMEACILTAGITAVMTAGAIIKPALFSRIGGFLSVSLIGLLVVGIIQLFILRDFLLMSYIGAALFSLYIGYDIYRAQQFAPTMNNAIQCALDIYLDVINLFMRILRILGRKRD